MLLYAGGGSSSSVLSFATYAHIALIPMAWTLVNAQPGSSRALSPVKHISGMLRSIRAPLPPPTYTGPSPTLLPLPEPDTSLLPGPSHTVCPNTKLEAVGFIDPALFVLSKAYGYLVPGGILISVGPQP
ncbi:hypothetical protein FOMPIDRAFT_1048770 [Fomitopsis schrenkii]|uniref:Uncharacterized protein n=1 Tax=Fomitopsis schrenkii TaxID=2126942 RepID=S8E8K6_FOMSC|nr:hypothetical protein FOMPIDRAFT_1048770 [Fomitopsis schrenkii]